MCVAVTGRGAVTGLSCSLWERDVMKQCQGCYGISKAASWFCSVAMNEMEYYVLYIVSLSNVYISQMAMTGCHEVCL